MTSRYIEHAVESLDELRARIAELDAVMVYFTEPSCQVGAAVEAKALRLVHYEFPKLEVLRVDTVGVPEAAGQLEVLTIPTLILFFAGRETARFVRTFGLDEVRQAIERPYRLMFE